MRNVVVCRFLAIISRLLCDETLFNVVKAFHIKFVLLGEFIDLLGKLLTMSIFVRVVQKLNFLENLQTADGDLLELMDTNDFLRRLVVH